MELSNDVRLKKLCRKYRLKNIVITTINSNRYKECYSIVYDDFVIYIDSNISYSVPLNSNGISRYPDNVRKIISEIRNIFSGTTIEFGEDMTELEE